MSATAADATAAAAESVRRAESCDYYTARVSDARRWCDETLASRAGTTKRHIAWATKIEQALADERHAVDVQIDALHRRIAHVEYMLSVQRKTIDSQAEMIDVLEAKVGCDNTL